MKETNSQLQITSKHEFVAFPSLQRNPHQKKKRTLNSKNPTPQNPPKTSNIITT